MPPQRLRAAGSPDDRAVLQPNSGQQPLHLPQRVGVLAAPVDKKGGKVWVVAYSKGGIIVNTGWQPLSLAERIGERSEEVREARGGVGNSVLGTEGRLMSSASPIAAEAAAVADTDTARQGRWGPAQRT